VVGGILTVGKGQLSISAKNVAVTYEQTPPQPTGYILTGFVGADTASVVSGAPILSTIVTSATPVGFYPIGVQVGTLDAADYYFVTSASAEGSVGVYKAPLTIHPNSVTIRAGDPLPTFTYTLTGFVNSDTQASATTGAPTLTTTAPSTLGSRSLLYPREQGDVRRPELFVQQPQRGHQRNTHYSEVTYFKTK
jgi:hypothetical protein